MMKEREERKRFRNDFEALNFYFYGWGLISRPVLSELLV